MFENLKEFKIVLGSASPRRQQLLKGLDIDFDIVTSDVDENFGADIKREEIPLYLAQKKAEAIKQKLNGNYLLITCDTVVWVNNMVLNKPENIEDAKRMLRVLSGNEHEVFTAVNLSTVNTSVSFYDRTIVRFNKISEEEIDYYIANYKPLDKAGSYGVQEWLGYIAIDKIEGCFFNVMGLPLQKLYLELKKF